MTFYAYIFPLPIFLIDLKTTISIIYCQGDTQAYLTIGRARGILWSGGDWCDLVARELHGLVIGSSEPNRFFIDGL